MFSAASTLINFNIYKSIRDKISKQEYYFKTANKDKKWQKNIKASYVYIMKIQQDYHKRAIDLKNTREKVRNIKLQQIHTIEKCPNRKSI